MPIFINVSMNKEVPIFKRLRYSYVPIARPCGTKVIDRIYLIAVSTVLFCKKWSVTREVSVLLSSSLFLIFPA